MLNNPTGKRPSKSKKNGAHPNGRAPRGADTSHKVRAKHHEPPTLSSVAVALRTFKRIADALGIGTEGKLTILNIRKTKYFTCLKMDAPSICPDSEDRLGYFLAIVELSENLSDDAGDWLRAPNTAQVFGGNPPLDLLLTDRVEGIAATLNYLKGLHGGWA